MNPISWPSISPCGDIALPYQETFRRRTWDQIGGRSARNALNLKWISTATRLWLSSGPRFQEASANGQRPPPVQELTKPGPIPDSRDLRRLFRHRSVYKPEPSTTSGGRKSSCRFARNRNRAPIVTLFGLAVHCHMVHPAKTDLHGTLLCKHAHCCRRSNWSTPTNCERSTMYLEATI